MKIVLLLISILFSYLQPLHLGKIRCTCCWPSLSSLFWRQQRRYCSKRRFTRLSTTWRGC